MSEQMKFLADMGVSPRCVEWLRARDYDAIHLYEQGLYRLPDYEVLRKAVSEKRVLLTMDLDFARLVSEMGTDNLPTVVIFRLSDQRPQSIQAKLEILFPILEKYIEQGDSILSVNDNKIRIRRLPIR